jgi:dolichol-phosphate mannosyltransferase
VTHPTVSFVIPTLDECETVAKLHDDVVRVCGKESIECQIIFVDDGSTDGTVAVLRSICDSRARTQAVIFRRNFGKAAALAAGFEAADGDVIITMDADLQDDPREIPRFLDKLDTGFDVVSGWKRVRHDPWHKVLPSRVFNWLVSRSTGVKLHDHNCGFKAYRRGVVDEVKLYGELHRFVPVLAAARGWKVGEIEVEHHARQFGASKYGASRLVKGFLDLLTIVFLTGFGRRPLHLIGSVGLLCFAAGGIGMFYLSSKWVVTRLVDSFQPLELHKTAIFYYCILAVLLGAQLLAAGLLAELMVALARSGNPPYSVAERFGSFGREGLAGGQADQTGAETTPTAGSGG